MSSEFAAELHYAHEAAAIADVDPTSLDTLGVRDLLIAIKAAEDELVELQLLKAQIVSRYQSREDRLKHRIVQLRDSVQVWIERMNDGEKVSFPDVGTAFIQTRPPKVVVTNEQKFHAWAGEREYLVIDTARALSQAKVDLKEGRGLPPGLDLDPAETGLAIRRAS